MRVSARMTGAALVVTAALALTGCNSHSSSHHGKKHKSSSSKHKSSKHKSAGGIVGGGSSATRVHASSVDGQWKTGSVADKDYVVLVLAEKGDTHVAVVNTLGGGLCKGSYEQAGRNVHIGTSCKANHQFESGLIKKYRYGKLTVKWGSGETDVFTKAAGAPTP